MLRPLTLSILFAAGGSVLFGDLATEAPAVDVQQRHGMRAGRGAATARTQFLDMAARSYFPGRSGHLVMIPREGHIMTRDDPEVAYMHGSPWPYDAEIPLFFVGPAVQVRRHTASATQQDIAVTLAAALGTRMPSTATGRVLPVMRANAPRPRAVVLIVLDGMRPDYFDRYAAELPTLVRLRGHSAWFSAARVNYIPTNTGVGHSTIATGANPGVHGITGNNLFNSVTHKRSDLLEGWQPRDLAALTIADVWQLDTRGRAVILAQGGSVPAATALAGHGACQLNGVPTVMAGYDQNTGRWNTNRECYTLPDSLDGMDAKTLWPADGRWMGHQIASPGAVRRTALFPRFEANAIIESIARSSLGADEVPDMVLLNFKGADFVGHKHGPQSEELRLTFREMDKELARILAAIESKVGKDYLLAITGDHGMPGEPASPDHRHLAAAVVDLLHDRVDPSARRLVTYYEPENAQIFVDLDRLAELHLGLADLARVLEAQPFVFAAFTQEEVRGRARALPIR
jgi:hypothetical protein